MRHRVYLGLGSNLHQPLAQLYRALAALVELPDTELACVSSFYRNPPLSGPGVPPQPDYLNAVAGLDTGLAPRSLLAHTQVIETAQGRRRDGPRWGPRPLDLDLLLYADLRLAETDLVLPHPGLTQRAFVLYPLCECAPDLILPDGRRLRELLSDCPPDALQRLEQL